MTATSFPPFKKMDSSQSAVYVLLSVKFGRQCLSMGQGRSYHGAPSLPLPFPFHTTKTWLAAPTIRTAPDLPSDNSTTLATTSIVEHRNTWPTTLTHLHLSKLQRSRKLNAMQWHLNCTFLVKYTLVQRVWEWECLKVCVRACVCVWQRLRESACVQKY